MTDHYAEAEKCPVCWSRYVPDRQFTNTGRHFVTLHRDGVGRYCPMSGKWFGLTA